MFATLFVCGRERHFKGKAGHESFELPRINSKQRSNIAQGRVVEVKRGLTWHVTSWLGMVRYAVNDLQRISPFRALLTGSNSNARV